MNIGVIVLDGGVEGQIGAGLDEGGGSGGIGQARWDIGRVVHVYGGGGGFEARGEEGGRVLDLVGLGGDAHGRVGVTEGIRALGTTAIVVREGVRARTPRANLGVLGVRRGRQCRRRVSGERIEAPWRSVCVHVW